MSKRKLRTTDPISESFDTYGNRTGPTPDPWGFELVKCDICDEAWIWNREGRKVATLPMTFPYKEAMATASLICAAPRLIRELAALVELVESGSQDGLPERLASARDAIASVTDYYNDGRYLKGRRRTWEDGRRAPAWSKEMKPSGALQSGRPGGLIRASCFTARSRKRSAPMGR